MRTQRCLEWSVDTSELSISVTNADSLDEADIPTSNASVKLFDRPLSSFTEIDTDETISGNNCDDGDIVVPAKVAKKKRSFGEKVTQPPKHSALGQQLESEAIQQAREIHELRKSKLNLKLNLLHEKLQNERNKQELLHLLKCKLEGVQGSREDCEILIRIN